MLRKNAYVNLNDIAKPFSKRVDNWMRLQTTKDLLEYFTKDLSYNGMAGIYLVYGEVNIHYTEWTDEQRLNELELNRDDIKDMYGR